MHSHTEAIPQTHVGRRDRASTIEADSTRALFREARRLVADSRTPVPWIYWRDVLATAATIWVGLWVTVIYTRGAITMLGVMVVGLALSRGVVFLHEIVHQPPRELPGLKYAWNALIGIPFLLPAFVYERVHRDHHRVGVYRTHADPEHAPDAHSAHFRAMTSAIAALAAPVILALRWLAIAPLSFTHWRLRRFIEERASGLSFNPAYRPRTMRGATRREALASELLAFLWVLALVALVGSGRLPVRFVLVGAGAIATTAFITLIRGELLHDFSPDGADGTPERQILDSVNLPRSSLLTALLLPVGIGYHALHHLDARLPYHAMDRAHRRLVEALPPGSAYHARTRTGVVAAIRAATARSPRVG